MGFDVQAFATGFLESRVKDIEKKGDEARAFEENQRTLADRNTQTLSKRNAVVQQVVGLSNMLRDNGASERVIQAAIAAGPQEITTLANKVTEARKAAGGGKLGASDIEALVNIPEGFSVMDTDTTNLIRKTYGLGYEGKGVTKDMPERSFMDRLRGDKQMDMARARLDREVIKDGYTAYDVNQMSAQQDYESLVPGTFITFNDIKVFRPSEDMDGFTRTINNLTKAVEDTGAYSTLDTEIKGLIGAIQVSEDSEEVAAAKARLPKAQAEMDELYLSTVGSTIQDMVDTYGESFTDGADGYLRSFLSESYVNSLSLGTTEADEDTEDDLEAAFPDATTSTPRATEPADATSTGSTTPEVEVSLLPDANMDELSAARPKVRPQPEGEPEVTSEVTPEGEPEVATISEQDADPLEITQYAPKLANAADSALGLSAAAETAQLNIDNQKTMAQAMATVTREEWDEMSRAERKEKGLPVRRLDIAYAGKDNFKKIEKERVESIRERAAKKFGIKPSVFDGALDSGILTELDLQIFVDHGDDILDFIKDNLYSTEPEGIIEAMSDWAEENEKTLPMDKSFLVKTFGTALEG